MLILFFSYTTTAVFNNTSPVDNCFRSQCSALQHPLLRVNVHYTGKCSGMQRLRHKDGMRRERRQACLSSIVTSTFIRKVVLRPYMCTVI